MDCKRNGNKQYMVMQGKLWHSVLVAVTVLQVIVLQVGKYLIQNSLQ